MHSITLTFDIHTPCVNTRTHITFQAILIVIFLSHLSHACGVSCLYMHFAMLCCHTSCNTEHFCIEFTGLFVHFRNVNTIFVHITVTLGQLENVFHAIPNVKI